MWNWGGCQRCWSTNNLVVSRCRAPLRYRAVSLLHVTWSLTAEGGWDVELVGQPWMYSLVTLYYTYSKILENYGINGTILHKAVTVFCFVRGHPRLAIFSPPEQSLLNAAVLKRSKQYQPHLEMRCDNDQKMHKGRMAWHELITLRLSKVAMEDPSFIEVFFHWNPIKIRVFYCHPY